MKNQKKSLKTNEPYPYPVIRNRLFSKQTMRFYYKPNKSVIFYDQEIAVYRNLIVEQDKTPKQLAEELGLQLGEIRQIKKYVQRFVMLANHYEKERKLKAKKDSQILKLIFIGLLFTFKDINFLYKDLFISYHFSYIKLPLNCKKLSTFYDRVLILSKEAIDLGNFSVSKLSFSQRTKTALLRFGIDTLELLIELKEEDIEYIKGAGKKAKQEIFEFLNSLKNEFSSNQ